MESKAKAIMTWLADRMREPSTFHGLNIILVAAGITMKPEMLQAIITMGMAISSVILIVTEERK